MKITLQDKDGVILKTANKYCDEDIEVQALTKETSIIPTTKEQVKEGLFNKVTVAGDINLDPKNIKKGVVLFGVEGTYDGTSEAKYIQSSGAQYIDTGIQGANDVEFEIKFNQYDKDTSAAHAVVLGARQSYKYNSFMFFNVLSNNFKNKGIWIGNREDITTTNYTHYQVDTVATLKNGTLTLSSSQGTESHAITMPAAFTSPNNIVLFGAMSGNTFEMATKMKLYYCKIWKAGQLVRDFVPYNNGGVYCLKDKVTNTFFLSPNGQSFGGEG